MVEDAKRTELFSLNKVTQTRAPGQIINDTKDEQFLANLLLEKKAVFARTCPILGEKPFHHLNEQKENIEKRYASTRWEKSSRKVVKYYLFRCGN